MNQIRGSRGWVEFVAEQQTSGQPAKRGGVETPAEFVLRAGRQFPEKFREIPGARDVPRECFTNATLAVLDDEKLWYCEGWACNEAFPFPTEHAWCWDGDSIIDPTWGSGKGSDYFGVAFPASVALRVTMVTQVYGVLGAVSWRKWVEVSRLLEKAFPRGREENDDSERDGRDFSGRGQGVLEV